MHAPDRITRCQDRTSLVARDGVSVRCRRPIRLVGAVRQGNWGSMSAFADYTHQLVPFASGWLLTAIVWTATATETTLGVLLLTGWWPKLVGAASLFGAHNIRNRDGCIPRRGSTA